MVSPLKMKSTALETNEYLTSASGGCGVSGNCVSRGNCNRLRRNGRSFGQWECRLGPARKYACHGCHTRGPDSCLRTNLRRTPQPRGHSHGCVGKRSSVDGDAILCACPSPWRDKWRCDRALDVFTSGHLIVASCPECPTSSV